jgi:hypothetical protein
MRTKRRIEKLEDYVIDLSRRVWSIENPFKFDVGDIVKVDGGEGYLVVDRERFFSDVNHFYSDNKYSLFHEKRKELIKTNESRIEKA